MQSAYIICNFWTFQFSWQKFQFDFLNQRLKFVPAKKADIKYIRLLAIDSRQFRIKP